MGELARDIIKIELNLPAHRKPGEFSQVNDAKAEMEDDFGDVLFHLLELANAYDVDLTDAFEKAYNNIKERFGMK